MIKTIVLSVKKYPIVFLHPFQVVEIIDHNIRHTAIIGQLVFINAITDHRIFSREPIGKV